MESEDEKEEEETRKRKKEGRKQVEEQKQKQDEVRRGEEKRAMRERDWQVVGLGNGTYLASSFH
jgi:hypothetical protein